MRRFEFAMKNGIEYYLPEVRNQMTGIEKSKISAKNTASLGSASDRRSVSPQL